MPAKAGVKRGKLYPEQGQIGGRFPACRDPCALHSPRVGRMSRRATGGPRWMAIVSSLWRRGTELGLQAALADVPPMPCHGDAVLVRSLQLSAKIGRAHV